MIRDSLKWVIWSDIFSSTQERKDIFAEHAINNFRKTEV